jgi:hypothetical protein
MVVACLVEAVQDDPILAQVVHFGSRWVFLAQVFNFWIPFSAQCVLVHVRVFTWACAPTFMYVSVFVCAAA